MESRKSVRSKAPLAGLSLGLALTLGVALAPGAWGPVFGDTTPGGGGGGGGNQNRLGSGGVFLSSSAGPGQTATGVAGSIITILGNPRTATLEGAAAGTATFPGICSIVVASPINVLTSASIAGPNAYNVLIQPATGLGANDFVLATVVCHVTPPANTPPLVSYTVGGGEHAGAVVNVEPSTVTYTANPDGSWEVKVSQVNVADFANGGAVLQFQ